MTIDQLENLTIYEIREVARRAGLIPGTKRKSEMIDEIIAVSEGKLSPVTEKKFGRPPKSIGLADLFVSSPTTAPFYSETIALNQNPIKFKHGDMQEISGYLEVKSKGGGILWEKEDGQFNLYAVPLLVVESHNLRHGDKILASANATPEGSIIKEIFRINDVRANLQPKHRLKYEQIKHITPNKTIPNNKNLNLMFGECYFIIGDNSLENSTQAIDFLNNCNADYKIYINNLVADKNAYLLNNLNEDVEQFTVNVTDDVNLARVIIRLAYERAKRILELGKTCIMLIDDLGGIMGMDENNYIARNLLNLTKNSSKGAITVVAVAEDNKYTMPYFKLADKKFKVENGEFV